MAITMGRRQTWVAHWMFSYGSFHLGQEDGHPFGWYRLDFPTSLKLTGTVLSVQQWSPVDKLLFARGAFAHQGSEDVKISQKLHHYQVNAEELYSKSDQIVLLLAQIRRDLKLRPWNILEGINAEGHQIQELFQHFKNIHPQHSLVNPSKADRVRPGIRQGSLTHIPTDSLSLLWQHQHTPSNHLSRRPDQESEHLPRVKNIEDPSVNKSLQHSDPSFQRDGDQVWCDWREV